ncbi:hypothetical protein F5Y19DRAFT_217785 [Xylariaceae sp. FL1651]|nr:hypothetical protein F5Y19DRAFT_217785 [Xylariaceae sp. FL1651]
MPGKHNYPYKKGVDITAWVLQIIVCLILVGFYSYFLAVVAAEEDSYDYSDVVNDTIKTVTGVSIAIAALTIVFDIVEIILIARKNMPPALYLTSACLKSLIWLIIFILELVSLSILGIILSAIVLVTSLVQLGFGARIVHKKRKGTLTGGNYVPALNPAVTGHVETGYGVPQAYSGTAYPSSPQQHAGDYYKPQGLVATPTTTPYGYPAPTPSPHQQGGYAAPPPQQGYGYQPNSYELSSR